MSNKPLRFNNSFTVSVPTTDWRTHPETDEGDHYIYGSGIVHHDLINIPFYGVMSDTAVIAHPLSNSECLADPRVKVSHIRFVMCQLREIQMQSSLSRKSTPEELRARQDSIDVLKRLRERALDRLWDRYAARLEAEALLEERSDEHCFRTVAYAHSIEGQRATTLRRDSVLSQE